MNRARGCEQEQFNTHVNGKGIYHDSRKFNRRQTGEFATPAVTRPTTPSPAGQRRAIQVETLSNPPTGNSGGLDHVGQHLAVFAVHIPRFVLRHRSVLVPPAGRQLRHHSAHVDVHVGLVHAAQHLQSRHVYEQQSRILEGPRPHHQEMDRIVSRWLSTRRELGNSIVIVERFGMLDCVAGIRGRQHFF